MVKADALVTGESLGQVASQTLRNIRVIERVATLPILRPLIGDNKAEIIARAEQLGTFEISTLPHDDCCSLFVPKHPATNASPGAVENAESELDIETLVAQAIESIEERGVESTASSLVVGLQ